MFSAPITSSPVPSSFTRRDALRLFGLTAASALIAPGFSIGAEASAKDSAAQSLSSQPGFYRFKIGAFEATAFLDGGMVSPMAETKFWKDRTAGDLGEVLKTSFLPTSEVRIPFCVLLVRMGSELVLVDSGAGQLFGPIGGRFSQQLAAAGVKPEQVTAVILTHAHMDHFGGLLDPSTKAPVFKNARHFIHRKEHEFWSGSSPDLSGVGVSDNEKAAFIASAKAHLSALKFAQIRGGEKLIDGLEIIDAPGHTPGHIALLFSSGNDQLLNVVDAVHHHALSFAQPDWSFAFDADPAASIVTRKRLLDRASADRLRVFGSHLPFPGLGHVRVLGKGRYEYVVEPWLFS